MQLLMASLGPIVFLGAASDALEWAHFNAHMQLSMASLGPIIFLGAAAYALWWAHFNARSMASPGPNNILEAAANALGQARRIRSWSCRWLRLGRLIFWQALLMCYKGLSHVQLKLPNYGLACTVACPIKHILAHGTE